MKEANDYYCLLKDNGDLTIMFEFATGVWKEDKKWFIKHYEETKHLLENIVEDDLFDDIYTVNNNTDNKSNKIKPLDFDVE